MEIQPYRANPNEVLARMHQDIEVALDGWVAPIYTDHLIVESSHVIVAADAHVPKHDQALIGRMLLRGADEGVDTVLWAGDLMDMEQWSSYSKDAKTLNFKRSLKVVAAIMRGAHRLGMRQYWTLGNHEQRLFRGVNENNLDMESLARMADLGDLLDSEDLIVSDNPSVYLPVGNWLVTHPAQYGTYPTVVAGQLATRNQANVIAAHEHHWGMTTDTTGQFLAISSGGLYDPSKHKYIQHNVTSHRAWQRGYVILHNGSANLVRGEATVMVKEVVDAR